MNTKITEIIIKVGVSSINFKEFLHSIINENLLHQNPENSEGEYSNAGTS